jgi:phosphoglycolate phosphatase-like HAD superfamily hydrolase
MLGLVSTPRRVRRPAENAALTRKLDDLFGPFDVVGTCFHALKAERDCRCVGLDPGTVRAAAAALRLPPSRCLVVGAVLSDVTSANKAGAPGVVSAVGDAIDFAVESLLAPDRALEQVLEVLELAWKAS